MLIVLLVLVAAIAALLAYAAMQAPSFRIERAAHIAAPLARIAALIDDFHAWQSWSPWEKLDPALQRTFSGPVSGRGTVYEWSGNNKAGAGRMEITGETVDASRGVITIRLDFFKPFKASNTAEFSLTPGAGGTELRWAMFGPRPFVSKLMGVFIDMDKMVGKDFEAGLAALKREAEQATS